MDQRKIKWIPLLILISLLILFMFSVINPEGISTYLGGESPRIIYHIFFLPAVFFGIYAFWLQHKDKVDFMSDESFEIRYLRSKITRIIGGILIVMVLLSYIIYSYSNPDSIPPYWLLIFVQILSPEVLWCTIYISENKIATNQNRIYIDRIESAEIVTNDFGKKIKFHINGKNHSVDFRKEKIRQEVYKLVGR